ncbi:MAG: hypothetical protein ACRCSP_10210 [Rhodoglobus sp.]
MHPFLSRQQLLVVALRVNGASNRVVATILGITMNTAASYMSTARRRFVDAGYPVHTMTEVEKALTLTMPAKTSGRVLVDSDHQERLLRLS